MCIRDRKNSAPLLRFFAARFARGKISLKKNKNKERGKEKEEGPFDEHVVSYPMINVSQI